ncbi:MAG: MBL fold metallo-hydrolase [Candidatus Levybacteria bacterium]|nr:MBL fold metallo-hydrolase [Candidatus Levybacteria bacterium]
MKKYFLIFLALLFLLGAFTAYHYIKFSDGKLHVVFCDVGQGDAIVIRTPKGKTILVDGGPDESVLGCLSGHMPFWQKTIEVTILTHPHADHFMGFLPVINRYKVNMFASEKLTNKTEGYRQLQELLQRRSPGRSPGDTYPHPNPLPKGEGERVRGGKIRYLTAGDRFRSGDVKLTILGPAASYLSSTSPGGLIGESEEFASLVLQLAYGSFDMLLTGDSQAEGLHSALDEELGRKQVDVLQVPHHGSKTGLDIRILEELNPKLAVISVGKNKYGHPSRETLEFLSQFKLKVLRTDQKGDIEIVSDGKKWWVR